MRRHARLEKLERPAVVRWRKAWECSAVIFDKHAGDIVDIMDTPGFSERLTAARPGATGDEVEAEAQAFLKSLGVIRYRDFEAWFNAYDIPEDDPPDLSRWPGDIPTPPDEPPGDWDRVAPFMTSENVIEQLGAQIYMLFLAMARATREERAAYGEAAHRGGHDA